MKFCPRKNLLRWRIPCVAERETFCIDRSPDVAEKREYFRVGEKPHTA